MAFIAVGGWNTATFPVQIPYQINVTAGAGIVQAGIDMWNAATVNTDLELIPQTTETAFLSFVNFTGICESPIGRQPNQPQEVRCDFGAGIAAADVAHEIGHAIGLLHEHQRPDRDANITVTDAVAGSGAVNGTNILIVPDLTPSVNIPFFDDGTIATVVGNYDCTSIMHYDPGTNFGANFGFLAGGCIAMGGNAISAGDIQGVQALYGGGTGNVTYTEFPVKSDGWHLTRRRRARRVALRRRRGMRSFLRDQVDTFRNQNPSVPAGYYDNVLVRLREESGFPVFFGVEFEARDVFVFWHF